MRRQAINCRRRPQDWASQSASLQHQVDFFQIDTTGNGWTGGTGAQAAREHGAAVRSTRHTLSGRSRQRDRRANQTHSLDGHHGVGHGSGGSAHPAPLPALPSHPAPVTSPSSQSSHPGTSPRGGVVVNLDDDDNFERF